MNVNWREFFALPHWLSQSVGCSSLCVTSLKSASSLNQRNTFILVASFEQDGLLLLVPVSRLDIIVALLFPACKKAIVLLVCSTSVPFVFLYTSSLVPRFLSLTGIAESCRDLDFVPLNFTYCLRV